MSRYIYILIGVLWLTLASTAAARSQDIAYAKEDSVTISRLLTSVEEGGDGCLPLVYARHFLDRPYVAHTLESFPDNERLIINTRQLDCTTLVETVTALVLCTRRHQTTFADYCAMLRQLRYRQGVCNGYPSRLHYFSDWIEDNTKMGFVKETQRYVAPFSAIQQLNINYMSRHPQAYTALQRHPESVRTIAAQERALTGRHYRYIPKSQVRNSAALRAVVRDGDIIAITTNKAGLDIAHLGFAVWKADGLHLLNASMIHKKVVEEPMTLDKYLANHSSHTGIRVITIKE